MTPLEKTAQQGQSLLEKAVLSVLLKARQAGECISAKDIGVTTGIFREPGNPAKGELSSLNDAIVTGILIMLMKQKRVQRCGYGRNKAKGTGGWELTAAEFKKLGEGPPLIQ